MLNTEEYITRNKAAAYSRYGDKIDDSRRVSGTDIWFDHMWRLHVGGMEVQDA